MARARLSCRFLLCADVIIQFPVSRFKFASGPCNIFFHHRKFRLCCVQLLFGQTRRFRAAQARPDKFGALFRKAGSPCINAGRSCFQICRSRIECVQIGELF